jgi:peptidoglycan/LPS O-acetylase OafA/YrhL
MKELEYTQKDSNYRPDIDGLRSIAILAVIVFHLNANLLPGGFTGVDIFFVISGYVVTGSILRKDNTNIFQSILEFYSRRIQRITPALVFCLFITLLLTVWFITPRLSRNFLEVSLWAFFNWSNNALIFANRDYFSTDEYLNPFLHTWSLGVEAQFYLLFPLLLILSKFFDKNRHKVKALWLTILFITLLISLIISSVFTFINPILAYYLMPSRFWEMASGAILFLSLTDCNILQNNYKLIRILLQLSSVFLIGLGFFFAKPNLAFPSPMAIPTVIGTLIFILLGSNQKSYLNKLVSNRFCLYVGKISYSLYLWHWPIFTIFRWTIGLDTIEQISIAILLTIGFGIASYQLIEIPFLQKKTLNSKLVLVLGLLIMTLSWRINLAVLERGWYFNYTLSTTKDSQTWYAWEYKQAVDNECFVDDSSNFYEGQKITIQTKLCDKHSLAKKTIYTLGDSHSISLLPMLIDAMKKGKFNTVLYSKTGCAVLGLTNPDSQCMQFQLQALKEIQKNSQNGDILLLPALRVDRLESGIPGGKTHFLPKSDHTLLKIAPDVEMYLKNLNQKGLSIVLPAPWPVFRASPHRCADWFNKDNLYCHGTVMSKDFLLDYRQETMEQLIKFSQKTKGRYIWDPFLVMCPGSLCKAFLNNKPLYMDGDHLSNFGSRYLTDSFLSFLAQF